MSKRKRLFWSAAVGVFLLAALFYFFRIKSFSFQKYCHHIFQAEAAVDTISLHYTLANPKDYGIHTYEVTLPFYNKEAQKEHYAKAENYLNGLKRFENGSLSKEDAYTHMLLSKALQHELKGSRFFYFQEVFSPSCGAQTQLPILMAEYTFRSKQDVEDYLSLLSQTDSYFKSLISFEEEKVKRGYGMPDYSLAKVITQCHTLITRKSLENNSHFLQTTFRERMSQCVSSKILSKEDADAYLVQNDRILLETVLPAYENLAVLLARFQSAGKNENGLCFYKDGKEYYQWLFYKNTGSSVSPQTAYEDLCKNYYESLHKLSDDLTKFHEDTTLSEEDLSYFPLNDPDQILSNLLGQMTDDFPQDALSTITLQATVKEVSASMQEYTAPAYYLTPPIDDNSSNVIYINPKSTPAGLSLYTTLAHEGYPGHLYQTTYYQAHQQKEKISPIRHILNYGGYVEGWALYTELNSYDYASCLYRDSEKKEAYALLCDIFRQERCSQLAMLSLLDIGIHYYGFTFDRAFEILSAYGVNDRAQARDIYEYIVEEPTNYPKYYWGYLEILSLKKEAQHLWGSSYCDYRFHQFFLQSGPSDFDSLKIRLHELK